jgi:hypothetical protein
MNVQISKTDFIQSVINVLVGQKSWGVSSGVGSFLTLEFGNPQVLPNKREHGEFHFWIYGCAWRIEKEGKFILGSQDAKEYIAEKAPSTLNDLVVKEIHIDPISLDTTIKFESGICLRTFSISSDMEHWILYLPERQILTAGPGFMHIDVKKGE